MALPARLPARATRPLHNINARYTIESVNVEAGNTSRLSQRLRDEMQSLVGGPANMEALNRLGSQLRRELGARKITQRFLRGTRRETVKVVYEAEERESGFGGRVPKLAYHSRLGWTAGLEINNTFGDNRFSVGIQTDSDELLERYSGLNARYERLAFGTDRVQLRVDFGTFHQQWNAPTLRELRGRPEIPGIYRERRHVTPMLMVTLTRGLTLGAGASWQQIQTQFPAVRSEASNAFVTTLRHDRRWDVSDLSRLRLDAGYSLRAATRSLDSDFAYTRHLFDGEVTLERGERELRVRAQGGLLNGRAPLFERYSLGNTRTLRGWNKFDVNPLGGDRVLHGSVEWKGPETGKLLVFYDVGTVYNRTQARVVRHSAGIGFGGSSFLLAVAFPLRAGGVSPVFITGLQF